MLLQMAGFSFLCGWAIFHCVYLYLCVCVCSGHSHTTISLEFNNGKLLCSFCVDFFFKLFHVSDGFVLMSIHLREHSSLPAFSDQIQGEKTFI